MSVSPYGEIMPVPGIDYRSPDVLVDDAFTWDVIPPTGEGGIVRVAFSSQLDAETREAHPEKVSQLAHYDEIAWGDAAGQEGFLYYFPDELDEGTLLARSFCLWRTAENARAASQRKQHRQAVAYAQGEGRDVYRFYEVQKDLIVRSEEGLAVASLARMTIRNGVMIDYWKAA